MLSLRNTRFRIVGAALALLIAGSLLLYFSQTTRIWMTAVINPKTWPLVAGAVRHDGDAVWQNCKRSMDCSNYWLPYAAESGSTQALDSILVNKVTNLRSGADSMEACTELEKSLEEYIDKGHYYAAYLLAILYERGARAAAGDSPPYPFCSKLDDFATAVRLLRLSASEGFGPAQAHLGELYYRGWGVPQNRVEAYHWFHMAADNGDAFSQMRVADFHREAPDKEVFIYLGGSSSSSSQHRITSYKWYLLTQATSGNEFGTELSKNMSWLENRMSLEEVSQARKEAADWWNAKHPADDAKRLQIIEPNDSLKEARSVQIIAQVAAKSTFVITTYDKHGRGIGFASGFFIKPNVVVTNHHALKNAYRAELKTSSGILPVIGVIVADQTHDLVLLSVNPSSVPSLNLSMESPAVGDSIFVMGTPEGFEQTFASGMISAMRQHGGNTLIQMTAPVSHGSSGSPVLNKEGKVVGIVIGTNRSGGQNLNFAIPARELAELLTKVGAAPKKLPLPD